MKLTISFQGLASPWFAQITTNHSVSRIAAVVSWLVVYIISLVGIILMFRLSSPGHFLTKTYLVSIYLLGFLITLFWDVIFFMAHDIQLALILYIIIFIFYLWLAYQFYSISPIAGFLQIPILIRIVYYIFQISRLYAENPNETILR